MKATVLGFASKPLNAFRRVLSAFAGIPGIWESNLTFSGRSVFKGVFERLGAFGETKPVSAAQT